MSYNSIAASRGDIALQNRVTAAVAQEGHPDSSAAGYALMWPVVTRSDIEAAYSSALAASNPNPGGDEAVITDGMILSAVQAELPNLPTA